MRQLKPKFLPCLRFIVMSRPANERHNDKRTLGLGMSCHANSVGALFVGIQIGSDLQALGKRHFSVRFRANVCDKGCGVSARSSSLGGSSVRSSRTV